MNKKQTHLNYKQLVIDAIKNNYNDQNLTFDQIIDLVVKEDLHNYDTNKLDLKQIYNDYYNFINNAECINETQYNNFVNNISYGYYFDFDSLIEELKYNDDNNYIIYK